MMPSEPGRKLRLLGWATHAGGATVALAAACVLQLAAYGPLERRRASCQERSAELDRHLEEADQVRAEHGQLSQALAEMEEQARLCRQRIPEEPREAEFLAQIARAAREVGLQIRDYRPGPPITQGTHTEMEVLLSCEGTHASICGFLEQLPKLPRLSSLVKLEISSPPAGNRYPVNMTLVIYFGAKEAPIRP